jgi:GNAT superfamily N-acetyltransferase
MLDEVVLDPEVLAGHLFGPSPSARVTMAEDGGTVAGMALWFPTFSTFLGRPGIWLEDLFVRPDHRGRGIGQALIRSLRARTDGRVEWNVLDWNQPSIDFYVSQGAVFLDDWRRCRVTGEALAKLGAAA